MDFITPTEITDSEFISSDVPEDDYGEWVAGNPYTVGDNVMVATTTADIHKNYECIESVSAGVVPDLLEEYCNDFTTNSWTDADYHGATTSISPAGQFEFDSGLEVNNPYASVSKNLGSPPNTFTIEVKTYFDALGAEAGGDHVYLSYQSGTWKFAAMFQCIGGASTAQLRIYKDGTGTTEVGTDEVKCNAGAAWQTWRFEVTKTVEADATCDVYLKNEGEAVFTQIGTAIDCDKVGTYTDGLFHWLQYGNATDHRISHVDTFKVATGLGNVSTIEDSPENNTTNWLELESTNRWAAFDGTLGQQTEQVDSIEFVLAPGAVDSIALLNIESTSVNVTMIENESASAEVYNTTVTTGISKTDLVLLDLPAHADCEITVTITNTGGTAKIGELIVGVQTSLGTTLPNPTFSIKDYSTKTQDIYGQYTIVERGFSKKVSCDIYVSDGDIDEVARLLAQNRAAAKVWVIDPDYAALIMYGYYISFTGAIPIKGGGAFIPMEIESLSSSTD